MDNKPLNFIPAALFSFGDFSSEYSSASLNHQWALQKGTNAELDFQVIHVLIFSTYAWQQCLFLSSHLAHIYSRHSIFSGGSILVLHGNADRQQLLEYIWHLPGSNTFVFLTVFNNNNRKCRTENSSSHFCQFKNAARFRKRNTLTHIEISPWLMDFLKNLNSFKGHI